MTASDNPMGLDGFEFVEFCAPVPGVIEPVFEVLGFRRVAEHRSKDVHLWRQNDVNFVLNYEPGSLAAFYAEEHGPSACGIAFRVRDAHRAYERALKQGAQPIEIPTGPMELRLPAIRGIGGAPLYLIDRYGDGNSIYDIDFRWLEDEHLRRCRPQGHRPSDPQRLSRAHGVVGQLLRAPVQFPRDSPFRYQGPADWPNVASHDRARRQDSHSPQ